MAFAPVTFADSSKNSIRTEAYLARLNMSVDVVLKSRSKLYFLAPFSIAT